MHITSIILLIFLIISITIAIYNRNNYQFNKDNLLTFLFLIITIYTSISIYDQECIITGQCNKWGWIRFGIIVFFIIVPTISLLLFGKSYIENIKKKYNIKL